MQEEHNQIQEEELKNDGRTRFYWLQKNLREAFWNWAKENKVKAILSVVIFLILVFYLRAWIHPLALGVRKYFALILFIFAIIWLVRRILRKKRKLIKYIGNAVLLGVIVLGFFYGPGIYRYIGLYYHYQTINKQLISELPLTEQERIHPLNSISNRLNQDGLPELSEATLPHIIIRNDGRLDFSMGIGPSTEYLYQRLTKNMNEVVSVPAAAYDPDFSANRHTVKFDVGESLVLSGNTHTAAIKKLGPWDYFNYEPDESKFIENDKGEWVQVLTLIKWKGFFIPRPVFGGVIVFEQIEENSFGNWFKRVSFGKGKFIQPDEIKNYTYLKNQNLQSDFITRFTAEAFRFQNGFLAPMPGYHNNDIRIPIMATDENQQPFAAYFNFEDVVEGGGKGVYHYFGLEPYQEDKRTLSTSVFIPSNGDNVVYYYDHSKNGEFYSGSSSVSYKVIDSKKNYDWNAIHPAETRPYIKMIEGRRQFFWLSTIVTKIDPAKKQSMAGTNPELTLTDAASGEVFWIYKKNLYSQTDTSWVNQVIRHESY